MGILERVKKVYEKKQPLDAGFHSYIGDLPDGGKYRAHLRVEQGGSGILVINAAKVLHLNQTAVEFAKLMLDGLNDAAAIKIITSRYKVNSKQAKTDYKTFKEKIMCLIESDEVCPVAVLDFGRVEPFSMPVSAPYRMDLALTHCCDLDCGHCYAGGPRQTQELNTDQWKQVIDKLHKIGIPHICFTGGEATLVEGLPELIGYAEDLGLVTGLLTNGCRLAAEAYVRELVNQGLDHVQITLESHDKDVHNGMVNGEGYERTVKGIRNALDAGLYTVTNTTITRKNMHTLVDTVGFLHKLGIKRFAMNGIIHSGRAKAHPDALVPEDLAPLLDDVVDAANELDMNFIWYTPTRYCELDPLEFGLGMKRCTAGQYNMCIEPDGSVLPCQSYFEPVGNFLKDKWEDIWNAPLLNDLRERKWVDDECRDCDELSICGGGCPLEKEDREVLCTESLSNF